MKLELLTILCCPKTKNKLFIEGKNTTLKDIELGSLVTEDRKCFYPTYSVLIDWNGDIFLCPQDWQRRVSMGNVMQETIFEIWTGKTLTKYRKDLLQGKRCSLPCTKCNADGTLLGRDHAKKWKLIYKM